MNAATLKARARTPLPVDLRRGLVEALAQLLVRDLERQPGTVPGEARLIDQAKDGPAA